MGICAELEPLRSRFSAFTSITPIHGLGFAHNANNAVAMSVWIVLVLLGAGLFCRDLYNLNELRNSEPTATLVSVVHTNTLNFEQIQICMGLKGADWIRGNIFNLTTAINELSSYITTNNSMDWTVATTKKLSTNLVSLLYVAIATQAEQENCMETGGGSRTPDSVYLTEIYKFTSYNNITLENLTKFSFVALCKHFELTFSRISILAYGSLGAFPEISVCQPENFLLISEKLICSQLSQPVEFNYDKIDSQAGFAVSLQSDSNFSSGDLTLYGGTAKDQSNSISVQLGVQKMFLFKIDGSYLSYNKARAPCSNDERKSFDCRQKCKTEKTFRDICSCWPLKRLNLRETNLQTAICPPNKNGTNFGSTFGNCTKRVLSLTALDPTKSDKNPIIQQCNQLCPQDCQFESYSFDELQKFESPVPYQHKLAFDTLLWVRKAKFVYPKFEESPLFTTDYLLAQVGGSLGLWLGGSIIAIAHIPIFFVGSIVECLKPSRREKAVKTQFSVGCETEHHV